MDRRRLFAVGSLLLLAVLAGCSAAGSLEMQSAADDATLAERVSQAPPSSDEGARDRQVVQRAIDNGTATARSREPVVEPGLPYRSGGRYYNLSWSVADREPGTSHRLGIDYNGTAPRDATVAYENLTDRDREMVDQVLPPTPTTHRAGPDYYFDATYTDPERNESVLLTNGTDAVRYEGETYPVVVEDTDTVSIVTRRYTATIVANSSETYARQLRSEYVFTLSGLSDAEQSVVAEAINDTYYADTDDDEPFQSVLETFNRHEAVQKNEYRGIWLVRYEGDVYLADLSYEGFDIA